MLDAPTIEIPTTLVAWLLDRVHANNAELDAVTCQVEALYPGVVQFATTTKVLSDLDVVASNTPESEEVRIRWTRFLIEAVSNLRKGTVNAEDAEVELAAIEQILTEMLPYT
mgnify:CR=1 FL=1